MTKTTSTPRASRNFRDVDTGRSFEAGKPVAEVEPGLLENYRAAGLLDEAASKDAA